MFSFVCGTIFGANGKGYTMNDSQLVLEAAIDDLAEKDSKLINNTPTQNNLYDIQILPNVIMNDNRSAFNKDWHQTLHLKSSDTITL